MGSDTTCARVQLPIVAATIVTTKDYAVGGCLGEPLDRRFGETVGIAMAGRPEGEKRPRSASKNPYAAMHILA